ncbi:PAS/PAC sensor signal transduction histidine kinase [Fibrella aestuarina BUZ 2]|uniref:histidine kinase n=1 Tax=Fibrella aestuarina BUZ 2 TaxID=1166018 RepID=I0K9Q6_9BACT|nr:ATP-binding protein [Fibrella aestuarina]CCH00859.1 PAS/PAC sensor signal transduction histidine kinase [Fibrella aestuarina BUZ 2]
MQSSSDVPAPAADSTVISLMQAALDQSASGIIVCEAVRDNRRGIQAARVVLVNRRAEQYLGLSRSELIGQTGDSILVTATSSDLWPNVYKAIETGEPNRYDVFLSIRRSEVAAWFDMCIEPVGDGERVVVSLADITEIRNAKQALMGESILFKALSSTVPEMGVIVTDYFKKILTASGLLPDLLSNTNPDELVGGLLENFVLPEFRQDWRNYLGTALRGEAHFFSDHWAGWRSEVYVGPVYNDVGAVVMILVVFRNVTEQYRQQQALIQSNMALEQSNRSLEQFAYVASHDLQEPLRKIKSFGDLLRTNYGDAIGEEGIGLIQRMQSASERMSTLIQSLLAYARLSSEQRSPSVVHLEDLFNELISDLSVAIQERNGVVRLKPPLPIIPGDEQQLRQLFQNLLTNALKFVPSDRTPIITIGARVVEGPKVPHVAAAADAIYAEVDIQDNGIGIDKENYDKIFGLFNRLHGRKQYEGSGIGLATTKKVVENHKGAITIDSQLDKGTTFHVYLPMKGEGDTIEA